MKFVDRTEEIDRLKGIINSPQPSLSVIFGRRRLGKSTLLKKVLSSKDVYYLADKSESQHQRALLAKMIGLLFADFDKVEYPDWETLFLSLNHRTEEKFALCLDEFPYLVEQAQELPSVLQKLIDGKSLKYDIVVCGSSQNMMYGIFLDSNSPLYGRADEIIKLMPIPIPFLQDALGIGDIETIEEYAVWGGVPRYWELREKRLSLEDSIRHNCFSVNGVLFEEPAKLFQDDIKDIVKTSTIMSYVASGANRLSEIAARCGEPATNLSRPLRKLIDLGFLEKEVPFGIDEKNSKKSLYKIADPFISFYYKYVIPNQSFIQLGRIFPVSKAWEEGKNQYVSMWWEKFCRDAVTGNIINGILYGKASRWWGNVITAEGLHRQIELDVVAESIDGTHLLVGECKWTNHSDATSLIESLYEKAKLLSFAKNKKIVPILFLRQADTLSNSHVMSPSDVISLIR